MIALPPQRVGPYVRALVAALEALAPDESWVGLQSALAHVRALDPALSGPLLQPAEVSSVTGMPSYSWLQRAAAEAEVARRADPSAEPTDAHLERIRGLDADLFERMSCRRSLHQHLRASDLLVSTGLTAAARRLEPTTDIGLRYDRLAPDGRWERIRIELRTDHGVAPRGLRLSREGRVVLDPSLQHLLTRHFATPLMALRAQLVEATGARISALSRGWVGPFWWPGMQAPRGVPAALTAGLCLHASLEVVGEEVRNSGHLDPWLAAPEGEAIPEGQGLFRERRLAVGPRQLEAARAWYTDAGLKGHVAVIGRPATRRL